VSAEEAIEGVAGYTCVNDVTARDLQRTDNQWTRAKGFDTFCPIGPVVVSLSGADEWRELEVICRVNGEERQHGYTKFMHFGVPELVVYISTIMTLEPGDLIATGTPARVGPLHPGDQVEVEIPRIGILSNPVVMREEL
jgi:2-keto-4-pentenoate hydratase/2-oxohepta-3-ene-1,7-dioic acid hydratase in catechol pathway